MCDAIGDHPADYGSEEHLTRIIHGLADIGDKRMLEKVKWARWGSHQDAVVDFIPRRPVRLFVCDCVKIFEQDGILEWLGEGGRDPSVVPDGAVIDTAGAPPAATTSHPGGASSSSSVGGVGGASSSSSGSAPAGSETATPAASGATLSRCKFRRLTGPEEYGRVLADWQTRRRASAWSTFTALAWNIGSAEFSGFHGSEEIAIRYHAAYARGVTLNLFENMFSSCSTPTRYVVLVWQQTSRTRTRRMITETLRARCISRSTC